MFCQSCGKELASGVTFCSECGAEIGENVQVQDAHNTIEGTRDQVSEENLVYPKNPPMSPHLAWLTLIIPGLPQLIFGQVAKGVVCFIVFLISIPTGIGPLVVLIAALVDAYMVGNVLHSAKPIKRWQFFPK